jgi:hypothetical protein
MVVLACLSADEELIGSLRTHESASVEPLGAVRLAAWQQQWHASGNPDMHIVTALFNHEDVRVNLDIWVVDGGVRGVWKSAANGAGASIGIASRWMDALRNRDLAALTRLTRYPFEVRDTGRDARCKTRIAAGPATLESTLGCLLGSEPFHRALIDSPSPRVLADGAIPQSLAEWSRPWWRQKTTARCRASMPWSQRPKVTNMTSNSSSSATASEWCGSAQHSSRETERTPASARNDCSGVRICGPLLRRKQSLTHRGACARESCEMALCDLRRRAESVRLNRRCAAARRSRIATRRPPFCPVSFSTRLMPRRPQLGYRMTNIVWNAAPRVQAFHRCADDVSQRRRGEISKPRSSLPWVGTGHALRF